MICLIFQIVFKIVEGVFTLPGRRENFFDRLGVRAVPDADVLSKAPSCQSVDVLQSATAKSRHPAAHFKQ